MPFHPTPSITNDVGPEGANTFQNMPKEKKQRLQYQKDQDNGLFDNAQNHQLNGTVGTNNNRSLSMPGFQQHSSQYDFSASGERKGGEKGRPRRPRPLLCPLYPNCPFRLRQELYCLFVPCRNLRPPSRLPGVPPVRPVLQGMPNEVNGTVGSNSNGSLSMPASQRRLSQHDSSASDGVCSTAAIKNHVMQHEDYIYSVDTDDDDDDDDPKGNNKKNGPVGSKSNGSLSMPASQRCLSQHDSTASDGVCSTAAIKNHMMQHEDYIYSVDTDDDDDDDDPKGNNKKSDNNNRSTGVDTKSTGSRDNKQV